MFKFAFYFIIFVLLLFFGFNNAQIIEFKLLPNHIINIRLYFFTFVVFLIGYVVCYISFGYKFLRVKTTSFFQKKKITALEKKLESCVKEDVDKIEDQYLIENAKS